MCGCKRVMFRYWYSDNECSWRILKVTLNRLYRDSIHCQMLPITAFKAIKVVLILINSLYASALITVLRVSKVEPHVVQNTLLLIFLYRAPCEYICHLVFKCKEVFRLNIFYFKEIRSGKAKMRHNPYPCSNSHFHTFMYIQTLIV